MIFMNSDQIIDGCLKEIAINPTDLFHRNTTEYKGSDFYTNLYKYFWTDFIGLISGLLQHDEISESGIKIFTWSQ